MPGADRVRVSGIAARAVAFACACALALTSSGVAAQTVEGAAALVGGRVSYDVKAGDTLKSIGARFGVDEAALIEMNQLANPNALAVGQRLTFDNTHIAVAHPEVNLTINIGQRLLVLTEGESVRAYPIAAGRRSWATPVGAFTITSREIDPVWEVPLSIQREMEQQGKTVITRMEPSPLNPLGRHWIGLSLPGIGIHGTNAPSSVYSYSSHGCIRMHPDDAADVFARVTVGMTGVVVYEPVVVAVIDDRIWLEAHPDVYRRAGDAARIVRDAAERAGVRAMVDWALADEVIRQRRGRAVDVTLSSDPRTVNLAQ